MRINRSLLNWGVFLIAFGGIPLAVDQGWLDAGIAGDLGQLWPLILVGIGLGLILRWTPFAWFGGAMVAATLGIILGAAVASVPDDVSDLQGLIPAVAAGACSGDDAGPAKTSASGLANPAEFKLEATLSCGELAIGRGTGATWSLEAAHDTDDAPLVVESDRDGATASVRLSQDSSDKIVFLGRQVQSDWRVELPETAALSVDSTLNAVQADIDVGAGSLTRLNATLNASDVMMDLAGASTPQRAAVDLTMNASDGELRLPDGDVIANITLNASSLTVCVPESAALRVQPSSILSSDNLGSSGLDEAGSELWTTPGFNAAGDFIDLNVTSTVSSFSIERPETCS
jgi:hypothetical protein